MAVIDDPAAAIAASRCLAARSADRPLRRAVIHHPRPCSWCDIPAEQLAAWIDGWNEWAQYDERSSTFGRHDARVFDELLRRDPVEAERRIVEAQGLEPEATASTVDDEELAAWT